MYGVPGVPWCTRCTRCTVYQVYQVYQVRVVLCALTITCSVIRTVGTYRNLYIYIRIRNIVVATRIPNNIMVHTHVIRYVGLRYQVHWYTDTHSRARNRCVSANNFFNYCFHPYNLFTVRIYYDTCNTNTVLGTEVQ